MASVVSVYANNDSTPAPFVTPGSDSTVVMLNNLESKLPILSSLLGIWGQAPLIQK